MPKGDQLIAAIEAIHAAGLEAELWPQALGAITQLCGAGGATFEVFHKPTQRHTDFYSVGMPTTVDRDYVEHWGPISPRVRSGLRQKAGELGWDYQFIDDAAMDRDAFYADFLGPAPRSGISSPPCCPTPPRRSRWWRCSARDGRATWARPRSR